MSGRVAALVGATAVGKSETALALAPALGAEIVSVDSMQIYKGMDIGTAKPSPAARAAVPHHLIDLVDPSTDVTVAEFQRLARDAIAAIAARGRLPLLVGGSGLYLRAVVDDLRFPPRAASVRDALEAEMETHGPEALHRRLTELDPRAAARIEPANARRIARALEVMEVTGRPFSENNSWDSYESIYRLRVAGLTLQRTQLYARIERRTDAMLAAGLADEARKLETAGMGRGAGQALGYRQILEAPPDRPGTEVRSDIVAATKRFARRQESWFRSDPRVVWFDAAEPTLLERLTAFFGEEPS